MRKLRTQNVMESLDRKPPPDIVLTGPQCRVEFRQTSNCTTCSTDGSADPPGPRTERNRPHDPKLSRTSPTVVGFSGLPRSPEEIQKQRPRRRSGSVIAARVERVGMSPRSESATMRALSSTVDQTWLTCAGILTRSTAITPHADEFYLSGKSVS